MKSHSNQKLRLHLESSQQQVRSRSEIVQILYEIAHEKHSVTNEISMKAHIEGTQ